MKLSTKKYGGDPIRTYKILMKKLIKEGVIREAREKEFFKSKAQLKRESLSRAIRREKKQQLKSLKNSSNDSTKVKQQK